MSAGQQRRELGRVARPMLVLTLALSLLVVAALGWLWLRSGEPMSKEPQTHKQPMVSPQLSRESGHAAAAVQAHAPALQQLSAPAPGDRAASAAAVRCGPGLDSSASAASSPARSDPAVVMPLLKVLQAGGSSLHELAALNLQALTQMESAFQRSRAAAGPCQLSAPACLQRSVEQHQAAQQAAYVDAAREGQGKALRSGEPAAFQMALQLCAALPAADRTTCSRPLLQAWLQREPDNATPWLMLASVAREQGQDQEADEALYRASIAPDIRDGGRALWGLMASPAFAPEGGAAAAQLQQQWAALMAGMNYSSLGNLSELCGETALRDGNLAQRCDAIAQRLLGQGGSLIHRVEGLAIAHRLAWPQDRLSALQKQTHDLLKRDSEALQAQAEMGPCGAMQAFRERALQAAKQGELGHLLTQAASAAAKPAAR